MAEIHSGQCGLCTHYGENNPGKTQLIQIRLRHEAPESFIEECGHPAHSPLHLMVTPISGCQGFAPVGEPARSGD